MAVAKIYSAQAVGLRSEIITIEVDLFKGFYSFNVVGLADKAVEESRDRLSSAIKSIGFPSPKSKSQKVVISLAPADIKKEGPSFDLPMALGYLLVRGEIRFDTDDKVFLGELSLGGALRPVKGAIMLAQKAHEAGFKELFLPHENAREAALIEGITVYGVSHIRDVISHVNTKKLEEEQIRQFGITGEKIPAQEKTKIEYRPPKHAVGFSDIREQQNAKRGLEIAAAGGHNIAFYGPPGTGKTLLARAFASILPPLSFDEVLEVTGIHSAAGRLGDDLITFPPFRAPHHTSSYISIIGGGTFPRPGEATLAHKGVLFVDEFPEYDRRVIESLRQPLEDGVVSIARAKGSEIFPAEFILIAALNPCPCGYHGDPRKACTCYPTQIQKYQRKISGPIIDRIDMWIEVPRIDHRKLSASTKDTASGVRPKNTATQSSSSTGEDKEIKARVLKARMIQRNRFKSTGTTPLNSRMSVRNLDQFVVMAEEVKQQLDTYARRLDLSARAYHRVMKLARTIADLDQNEHVTENHIKEALQYRPKNLFETEQ